MVDLQALPIPLKNMLEEIRQSNRLDALDQLAHPVTPEMKKTPPPKKKILVVEDSSVIQNVIRQILEFQNYDVTSAKDGREALELCEAHQYDIILMDISMPFLDGTATLKGIRALEDKKKASVPVLAVTGNIENYTAQEFIRAGFNDLHEKPIDFDELSALVHKHLSASEAATA